MHCIHLNLLLVLLTVETLLPNGTCLQKYGVVCISQNMGGVFPPVKLQGKVIFDENTK